MSETPPFLPYSCPQISEEDIEAVAASLRHPIISQGERLTAFEQAFAAYTGSTFGVGFSHGTAALHGMCFAAGIGPGDEVIIPALTFVGTANVVLHLGAKVVFADIDPATFCVSVDSVRSLISEETRAVIAVDFAGQPADYDALQEVCDEHGVLLLSDAAHAPGSRYEGRPVGSLARMTAFSFNPVKNLTSGEGGMVTTHDPEEAERLRQFAVHGLTWSADRFRYPSPGGWYYEQQVLGLNYKLTEIHAALGLSQLARLDAFNERRRALAARYDEMLADFPVGLPFTAPFAHHVYHLYVVQVLPESPLDRAALYKALRRSGLGVQVHYIPVPMQPYYRDLGYDPDAFPASMRYYETALSLPLHHGMTDADVDRVVATLADVLQ